MEKTKEQTSIFERLHKIVKQNNLESNLCKDSPEFKPSLNSSYWDFSLSYKTEIDLEMR